MPCHTRMKFILLQGLLWLYLSGFGFLVASLEPGFLDFDNLPDTNFSCVGKVIGGYYADLETSCQMFHVCTIGQLEEPMDIRFLCLNGTVFDQETRVCERIDEVDCSKSEQFYSLNLELYGNTQPPILEDTPETEPPETLKQSTTTSSTTTPRSTKPKTTRPNFIITTTQKSPTTTLEQRFLQSHHFPVSQPSDIRFNPAEINISLNPGAPPSIRSKPVSFQQSISDNNKRIIVTTHTTVYKNENKPAILSTSNPQIHIEETQKPRTIVNYGLNHDEHRQQPRLQRPIGGSYNYNAFQTERSVEYETEEPNLEISFRPHTNFRPSIRDIDQYTPKPDYKPSTYRSHYHPTTINPLRVTYNHRGPTTYRNAYSSPLKPSLPYYHRTDKPPRIQLPLPLLPTLSPLTFSSPAPFSLSRHIETKRFTDHHQPPRIVISASASVSDATGRKFNYSLGTIGDSKFFAQAPTSYDDYKEDDVGLDPFYHDVPKLKRSKRNNLRRRRQKRDAEKKSNEDITSEKEAIDVIKFLFNWYNSHEKSTEIGIPISSETITEINKELKSTTNEDEYYYEDFDATTKLDLKKERRVSEDMSEPDKIENGPRKMYNVSDGIIVATEATPVSVPTIVTTEQSIQFPVYEYVDDNYEPLTYNGSKPNQTADYYFDYQISGNTKRGSTTGTENYNKVLKLLGVTTSKPSSKKTDAKKLRGNVVYTPVFFDFTSQPAIKKSLDEYPDYDYEVPKRGRSREHEKLAHDENVHKRTNVLKDVRTTIDSLFPKEEQKISYSFRHTNTANNHFSAVTTTPIADVELERKTNSFRRTKTVAVVGSTSTTELPETKLENTTPYSIGLTNTEREPWNYLTSTPNDFRTEIHFQSYFTSPEDHVEMRVRENYNQETTSVYENYGQDVSTSTESFPTITTTEAYTTEFYNYDYGKRGKGKKYYNFKNPETYFDTTTSSTAAKDTTLTDDVTTEVTFPTVTTEKYVRNTVTDPENSTATHIFDTLPTSSEPVVLNDDYWSSTSSGPVPIDELTTLSAPVSTNASYRSTNDDYTIFDELLKSSPTVTNSELKSTTTSTPFTTIDNNKLINISPSIATNEELGSITSSVPFATNNEFASTAHVPTLGLLKLETTTGHTILNKVPEKLEATTDDVDDKTIFFTTTNALYTTVQLQKFIEEVESNTKSIADVRGIGDPNMEITTTFDASTRTTTLEEVNLNAEGTQKKTPGEGNFTEVTSPTKNKGTGRRNGHRGPHRFSSPSTQKPERRKPITEEIVDVIKSRMDATHEVNTLKTLRGKKIEFNINAYTANLAYRDRTGATTEEEISVTAPSFSKSANPTIAKQPKDYLTTTPLSNSATPINVRRQNANQSYIFNCFNKLINKFYSDPRDCRLFHYCTKGFTKTQLLDMKFVCDLGTYFDADKLICTKDKPARCT